MNSPHRAIRVVAFASPLRAATKSVSGTGTLYCPQWLIHQATILGHDPILELVVLLLASFLFVLFRNALQGGIHRRKGGSSLCRPCVVHTVLLSPWGVMGSIVGKNLAMNPGIKASPRAVARTRPRV
jgi:hypothetical protein